MCGIAGFLERKETGAPEPGARARLEQMLRPLEHRGPDDWGMTFFGFPADPRAFDRSHVAWHPSAHRLALGHRRLSILDLSPCGRQPMASADGTLTVTFNGEIYNYLELREELARQAAFQTGTDTEVLLEAYRQWGMGMLERLDGMFAFALWDACARKLICARDPFGIKPFYYGQDGARFLFASEPQAVLAGLGTGGHLDATRVAEFLLLHVSDHDEGTSYQEVRQLPGGHWLEVIADAPLTAARPFWRPPDLESGTADNVPARVREQIELAVHRQLRSDVPVGSSLSGGLDSGSIVAMVGESLGKQAAEFTTLTLSNEGFDGDETAQAREMAARAGVRWVPVQAEPVPIDQEIDQVVRVMGEPFGGLSILGQNRVMRRAREHGLKVMLDGQGGDEVFLGYGHVAVRVIEEQLKHGRLGAAVHEWLALRQNAAMPLTRSMLGGIALSSPGLFHRYGRRRLRRLVPDSLLREVRPEMVDEIFRHRGIHGLQRVGLQRRPLPALLRYEDRNSMAYSIESRVPLLAVNLVETALRLPLRWKVRDGWTKYALRIAMKDRLPEAVLWQRRKLGYEVPQRAWVEAARPRIAAWLGDLPADCPINRKELLAQIDAGQSGSAWLWGCLSVALWIRSSGVRV